MKVGRPGLGKPRHTAIVLIVIVAGLGAALAGAAPTMTEFALPLVNNAPHDIFAGPDGNLWFTERTHD